MMKENYWFRAYKSGYGWYPHTWQGWLVIIFYIGLLIHSFTQVTGTTLLFRFFIFTAILTVITYLKGESITWGSKGKDQHKIP